LEKTGHMRHAFVKNTTDDYVSLTNEASYFKYHQSNKPRSSALPRRVMMTLRRQDATMIVKEFQSYIVSVLRSRGLR
jgi:phage gpG-like protein